MPEAQDALRTEKNAEFAFVKITNTIRRTQLGRGCNTCKMEIHERTVQEEIQNITLQTEHWILAPNTCGATQLKLETQLPSNVSGLAM